MPAPAGPLLADHLLKIVSPIIVRQFVTGLDGADSLDEHALALENSFAVGFAGVVDVAGEVGASGTVDGVGRVVEIEEVVAAFLVRRLVGDDRAPVLNNELPALDGRLGK